MSKDLKDIGENELENNIKLPEQEEVLMNEEELLNGLLEAANHRDSGEYHHKIQIKRNGGKVLFEFKIRPITEEEMQECRNSVTKYRPDPCGRQFPKIEYDVDYVKLRSQKIIKATVDEGKGILWDNKILKDKLGVLQAAGGKTYLLHRIWQRTGRFPNEVLGLSLGEQALVFASEFVAMEEGRNVACPLMKK